MRSDAPRTASNDKPRSRRGLWVGVGVLLVLVTLFVLGRTTGVLQDDTLQNTIEQFTQSPWGVPALVITFCVCAFLGVPQFLLIWLTVGAFGILWGPVWAWAATLCSGTITFWLGRIFSEATLRRIGEGRIKQFTEFVTSNVFAASAIVRNAPTGPFILVNMVFGAIGADFLRYIGGMAIGVIPKITMVTLAYVFGEAVMQGRLGLAFSAGTAAIAVFLGGFLYVRHRRRKGENIALGAD